MKAVFLPLLALGCIAPPELVVDKNRDDWHLAHGGRFALDRMMEHLPPPVRAHAEQILGELLRESVIFKHGKDMNLTGTAAEHECRRMLFEALVRGIWRATGKERLDHPQEEQMKERGVSL